MITIQSYDILINDHTYQPYLKINLTLETSLEVISDIESGKNIRDDYAFLGEEIIKAVDEYKKNLTIRL